MTTPTTNEVEPDAGSLESAMLATARFWLATLLHVTPDALDCALNVLADDGREDFEDGRTWLLGSVTHLPPSMATRRVVQLLSASPTLDAWH